MTLKEIREIFGDFKYENLPDGGIKIIDDWAKNNIITLKVNKLIIPCHHKVQDQIVDIFAEIKMLGIQDLVHYDGCWVPRHKTWDIKRSLSLHSWGIAIDINAKQFPYGSKKQQNPMLIDIFQSHGFQYGGYWRTPDPMHFQWERYV